MADVRLDVREGAFAKRNNGTIIVPGKPDESLLIKRILSDDAAYRMPPVFAHKTLTQEQKETLRRWVEQGAPWKDHWAFITPVRPPLPAVQDATWSRNPVDRFILAKLEAANLRFAPEADRRTLLRRVTLDLTGLPPTPDETKAFVNDRSANAYDKVIDRLLGSPHYGEHMAHYWLDAARYADTQGLHIDNYREMWPYRDWVIQAFNRNMRFDDFTVQQLAGDLLPNATLDQKIASGFQRCNVTTNEGGSVPAEVEAMYARDRADTTGTVWMGLTVGCATCHDHKFDPIAQKEMYSLTAFFRNTTQYPLDGNVPDTPPVVIVPPAEDRHKWDELTARRAALKEILAKAESNLGASFDTWLESSQRHEIAKTSGSSPLLELNVGDAVNLIQEGHSSPLALTGAATLVDGPSVGEKAIGFGKESSVALPGIAAIESDKPFTMAMWIKIPKGNESFSLASHLEHVVDRKPDSDLPAEWGWSASISSFNSEPSLPTIRLIGRNGKYISAQPVPSYGLKPATWYHVIFTYDGTGTRRGLRIYINGNAVPSYGDGKDLERLDSSIQGGNSPVYLGKQGKQFFDGGAIANFQILSRWTDEQDAKQLVIAAKVEAASQKEVGDLSPADKQALLSYFNGEVNPAIRESVAELHEIDAARYQIERRSATTFVQEERADAQPVAHILYRGLYDQPRDEVHPNVPAVLPPMPQSAPRNRLGLAQWLVDPNNPLTARVTVNRLWQQVFGTGLVKTAEDFGSQGEPPTHPELLDWLAVEFRESGWDVKKTLRLLVTSATYRQSAASTPEKLEHDRDNRLLSRGPRYRMDAEMLRDYALAASGLLNPRIGGPSVKPYQPPKVWETVAMDQSNTRFYTADTGDNLYRRSLYTFWKRSAPPPSMDIFDAPSREECVVRRERTNTPLQALVTMDDPQFVEAARVLAQNALLTSRASVDRTVNYMANRLLARDLDQRERSVVMRSYHQYLTYYQSDITAATKLVSIGESKPDPALRKPEFAAMTMVANELFNLDEALVK